MKGKWKEVIAVVALGIVAPWLIFALCSLRQSPGAIQPEDDSVPQSTPRQVNVYRQDQVVQMSMEDYLTGVLLAEMPGSFSMEAKKAQAVAARTVAMKMAETRYKHPQGAVCTQPSCCQGYLSPEDYLAMGGSNQWLEEARQAVIQTQDQVLKYQGSLIDATYFSCSGGYTEDAVAVWGTDVPYLQAVASPGEEGAACFTDTVSFTAESFAKALGVELRGDPAGWLGAVTYTEGGGVKTMYIGGVAYSGTDLRSLLKLRSTAFTISAVGKTLVITTKGYGHRVGMSQYGAQAMAASGKDYRQILSYYYLGTNIENA